MLLLLTCCVIIVIDVFCCLCVLCSSCYCRFVFVLLLLCCVAVFIVELCCCYFCELFLLLLKFTIDTTIYGVEGEVLPLTPQIVVSKVNFYHRHHQNLWCLSRNFLSAPNISKGLKF